MPIHERFSAGRRANAPAATLRSAVDDDRAPLTGGHDRDGLPPDLMRSHTLTTRARIDREFWSCRTDAASRVLIEFMAVLPNIEILHSPRSGGRTPATHLSVGRPAALSLPGRAACRLLATAGGRPPAPRKAAPRKAAPRKAAPRETPLPRGKWLFMLARAHVNNSVVPLVKIWTLRMPWGRLRPSSPLAYDANGPKRMRLQER